MADESKAGWKQRAQEAARTTVRASSRREQWLAYARYNPVEPWWPLQWSGPGADALGAAFADIARTHPAAFGVWREPDGTYTVAIKMEAKRQRLAGWKLTHEKNSGPYLARAKRSNIPDLLTLRTYLISLAKDPNIA